MLQKRIYLYGLLICSCVEAVLLYSLPSTVKEPQLLSMELVCNAAFLDVVFLSFFCLQLIHCLLYVAVIKIAEDDASSSLDSVVRLQYSINYQVISYI